MRSIAVAAVAAALLLATAASAQTVVDATDATFDDVIKSKDFVMMEFYAPWCGHCKKLEPEYIKAAELVGDAAVLAKMDATVEKATAGKYQIQGFPTIKIFRDGVVSGDYQGGRTADEIAKFVKGNVGPAVAAVASAEALETFKKENSVGVVIFLDAVGGDKFEAFEATAKELRTMYSFAVVTDAAVMAAEGVTAGSIVLFKSFDEKREAFSGDATATAEITAFVKAAGVPLFDAIGPHNYKSYLDRGLPIVWVFASESDETVLAAARASAPEFKGELSFVWIDSSKYGGMAQRLGLKGDKFPAVAIDNDGKHFAMPNEGDAAAITSEALTAFAKSFKAGELQQTIRSEPAPEQATVDGLTTVTGNSFEELVEKTENDVFIEFYAPWCGHCKQLAPVYEAVAKAFADKPVTIAKLDGTANDFPQDKYPVQGFPTMFFVPKGSKKPELYEGGRSEEALTTFLNGKLGAGASAASEDASEEL